MTKKHSDKDNEDSSTIPHWYKVTEILVKLLITMAADYFFPKHGAMIAMTVGMLEPAIREWYKDSSSKHTKVKPSDLGTHTEMLLEVGTMRAIFKYMAMVEHNCHVAVNTIRGVTYWIECEDMVLQTTLGTKHTFFVSCYKLWAPLSKSFTLQDALATVDSVRTDMSKTEVHSLRQKIDSYTLNADDDWVCCKHDVHADDLDICLPEALEKHMALITSFPTPAVRERFSKTKLPYMLKFLLSGPMGSGKSMFPEYVARLLGMDIVYVDLDKSLVRQFRDRNTVYVLNDMDLAKCGPYLFRETCHQQKVVTDNLMPLIIRDNDDSDDDKKKTRKDKDTGSGDLVLRVLCAFLDGQYDTSGSIVIASTNSPNRIDPILRRRFLHVELGLIEENQWLHLLKASQMDHPRLRELFPSVSKFTINVASKDLIQPFMFRQKYDVDEHVKFIQSFTSDVDACDAKDVKEYK